MNTTVSTCLVSWALMAAGTTALGQTVDQACDPAEIDSSYIMADERDGSTLPGDELYQNFVPSDTPLVRVDIKSAVRGATSGPAVLRVRILDPFLDFAGAQNELASQELDVQSTTGFPVGAWVEVPFDRAVDLIPGQTYTIAVSWGQSGTSLWWYGASGNPYPSADPDPTDLIPDDKLLDVDFAFVTYTAFEVTCYRDVDGDTYGDHSDPGTVDPDGICDPGTVADNSDCDDASAETYPGAAENELFGGCMKDADQGG